MRIIFSTGDQSKMTKFGFFAKLIIMTLAVLVASELLPGIKVSGLGVAILTAFVISLLNNFLRPVLIVLTLPFTVVTLGLFLLIINGMIIWLTGKIVPGFEVESFGAAFLFGLLITIFTYILEIPDKIRQKREYRSQNQNKNDEFAECEDVTDQFGDEDKDDENQKFLE